MDDEISVGLGYELDALLVVLLDQLSKVPADDILMHSELVLADVCNFEHHGGGHIHTVELLKVDLQMGWDVPLLLFGLFLKSLLLLSLVST